LVLRDLKLDVLGMTLQIPFFISADSLLQSLKIKHITFYIWSMYSPYFICLVLQFSSFVFLWQHSYLQLIQNMDLHQSLMPIIILEQIRQRKANLSSV